MGSRNANTAPTQRAKKRVIIRNPLQVLAISSWFSGLVSWMTLEASPAVTGGMPNGLQDVDAHQRGNALQLQPQSWERSLARAP